MTRYRVRDMNGDQFEFEAASLANARKAALDGMREAEFDLAEGEAYRYHATLYRLDEDDFEENIERLSMTFEGVE